MNQTEQHLNFIFDFFESRGKKIFLVGGAVRDILLGERPSDYDFATNVLPEEMCRWFSDEGIKTIEKGKRFGTVGVVLDKKVYEITTFRKDMSYSDGRHPASVIYTDHVKLDVIRRDFTINGLLMDKNGVIFDYVGGYRDLKEGVIRCIGDPDTRFEEDRLRKWRCIRLAAEKAMLIDEKTKSSIANDPSTEGVSAERIRDELCRIIRSKKVTWGGYLLIKTDLMKDLLRRKVPSFINREWRSEMMDCFETMAYIPNILDRRMAVLLIPMEPTERLGFLSFLHFPKKDIRLITKYCEYFSVDSSDIIEFKTAIGDLGWENFTGLLSIQQGVAEWENDIKHKKRVEKNVMTFTEISRRGDPIFQKDFAVRGDDFINAGYQGPEISRGFAAVKKLLYEHPECNNREDLLQFIAVYLGILKNKEDSE